MRSDETAEGTGQEMIGVLISVCFFCDGAILSSSLPQVPLHIGYEYRNNLEELHYTRADGGVLPCAAMYCPPIPIRVGLPLTYLIVGVFPNLAVGPIPATKLIAIGGSVPMARQDY